MIDPIERSVHCFDHRQAGGLCALDHNRLDSELPCRLDLSVSRVTAAILGDDDFDSMPLQHIQLVFQAERTPAVDIADMRHGQRRLDGIDAADPIMVLRRRVRLMRLLPPRRQENAQGCCAERGYGLRNAMHRQPVVAFDRQPGGTAQRKGRHSALGSRLRGIGGDARREGMGCVDHQINLFIAKIASKALRSAETAAAHRNGLRGWVGSSARKRQDDVQIGAGSKGCRQSSGLRRTAEDQNAGLAHG